MERPAENYWRFKPGPVVIKLFSCLTKLSMKFVLLVNLKLLLIAFSYLLPEKFYAQLN